MTDNQVISHNHYDHQDNNTLTQIYTHFAARPPVLFIPLNNTHNLPSNVPRDKIVEMDWWEERELDVAGKGKAKITCSMSLFDRAFGQGEGITPRQTGHTCVAIKTIGRRLG